MIGQPQPAPAPKERPLWQLDRGEQRALLITFVGGVASIVVAAIILGVAIALAHAFSSHTSKPIIDIAITTIGYMVLGAFAIPFLVATKRPANRFLLMVRYSAWVVVGLAGLGIFIFMLAEIGYIAGIH
jgi:hypothetical protein